MAPAPLPLEAPRRIGPYTLVERLGEGGMGVVWLARQHAPIARDNALKLLKRGLDTERIAARFDAERRTLALMDHPHIARVLDAGISEDGRPFFAMDLVRGERITVFCDREKLDLQARMRLFLEVCHAVRHAHQKGIIHRDLKPSNILVMRIDGRPEPRIIDFGVAKAIDESLSDGEHTRADQTVGTPEYMSPEQAHARPGGVDTRSDVYSLGVLLYELLTGRRPHDLKTRSLAEVAETLRQPPVRPSAVLSRARTRRGSEAQEVATLEHLAAARGTTASKLRRQLTGDLDTIVLHALAFEPMRRYQSVDQMAADVQRYLAGLPVEAARPTFWYRASRFAARHRVAVGGTFVLVALIVVAAGALARQRGILARERDRALELERRSRQEAQSADQVTDFLVSLFDAGGHDRSGAASPGVVSDVAPSETSRLSARQILDRGVERIGRELHDAPVVRARLLDTMGQVYRALGQSDTAEPLIREALAWRRANLAPDDSRIAESLGRLGRIRADRGALDEALGYYAEARRIVEQSSGRSSAPYAEVLNNMALVYMDGGQFERAAGMLEEAIAVRRRLPAAERDDLGPALHNFAVSQYELGKYQDAERLYREASDEFEARYGATTPHPTLIMVRAGHGLVLRSLNRLPEARAVLTRGVADARRLYTRAHPALATIVNNLALVAQDQGDFDASESLFREVLSIDREVSGPEHPDVAFDLHNLGWFLFSRRGRHDEGEAMLREALAMRSRLLGAAHPLTAQSMRTLGDIRLDRRDPAAALALYREAAMHQRTTLPRGHRQIIQTLTGEAEALEALGRRSEAVAVVDGALADLTAAEAPPDRSARLRAMLVRLKAPPRNRQRAPGA